MNSTTRKTATQVPSPTPTPWTVRTLQEIDYPHPGTQGGADTDYILKAVNSHAALVAACQVAQDVLHTIADGAGNRPEWNEGGEYYEALQQLKAALAQARP